MSLSLCGRYAGEGPTAQLYRDAESAYAAKRLIDEIACGGRCSGNHLVVNLAKVALEPVP